MLPEAALGRTLIAITHPTTLGRAHFWRIRLR